MRLVGAVALVLALACLPATASADYGFVTQWKGTGAPGGGFANPNGIGSDPAGNIYVADTGNQRIDNFAANGPPLATWGSAGSGPGQFNHTTDVAANGPSGNVY